MTRLTNEYSQEYPCIIVVPQADTEYGWYDDGVLECVLALVENVQTQHNGDTSRLYVVGYSMGGYAAWRLLTDHPKKIAAAVPVSGRVSPNSAPLFKDVPIWVFHGAHDDVVGVVFSRNIVKTLREIGGNVEYTEFPDAGHDCCGRAFGSDELVPWMFTQGKK
ncbi:MAG: alpha/beta fold hydrolase [Clostridia bacterium]|nr:alpha/beta fold hydrolase [Clostridia bacterium]